MSRRRSKQVRIRPGMAMSSARRSPSRCAKAAASPCAFAGRSAAPTRRSSPRDRLVPRVAAHGWSRCAGVTSTGPAGPVASTAGRFSGSRMAWSSSSTMWVRPTRPPSRCSAVDPTSRGSTMVRPEEVGDGVNRTVVVNMAWRSTLGADTVLRQRAAYVVGHRFLNYGPTALGEDRGAHGQVAYRADLWRKVTGGVLEAGTHIERLDTDLSLLHADHGPGVADRDASTGWRGSGYAHFAWTGFPRLTLASGCALHAVGMDAPGRLALDPGRMGAGAWLDDDGRRARRPSVSMVRASRRVSRCATPTRAGHPRGCRHRAAPHGGAPVAGDRLPA